jgi:hypothetical protein
MLEEYNQKTLARIAMSQILLQLQKKHNVMVGNIRKLLRLELRKRNIVGWTLEE